jgi:hypothetical protein
MHRMCSLHQCELEIIVESSQVRTEDEFFDKIEVEDMIYRYMRESSRHYLH